MSNGSRRSWLIGLAIVVWASRPLSALGVPVSNGEFDTDASGWSGTGPNLLAEFTSNDWNSSPSSGSALITNLGIPHNNSGVYQCVQPVVAGKPYELDVELRVSSGQEASNSAGAFVGFFTDTTCWVPTGPFSYTPYVNTDGSSKPLNTWLLLTTEAVAPVGAQSAWVYLNVQRGNGANGFAAGYDHVTLKEVLFGDGFEGGDTSSWSDANP